VQGAAFLGRTGDGRNAARREPKGKQALTRGSDMRMLFTVVPSGSHFNALVPLGRALQAAGHDVAFATAASFKTTVEDAGFGCFISGPEWEQIVGDAPPVGAWVQSAPGRLPTVRENVDGIAQLFIGGFGLRMVRPLLDVASHWRPDWLVHGSFEVSASVVGERLGIPHASIQTGGINPADMAGERVVGLLDALRLSVGLAPDPGAEALYRYVHISAMPAAYFGEAAMPRNTCFIRPGIFDRSAGEGLPRWVEGLGERPVVYVTLGTVSNRMSHIFRTIVAALRDEPLDVVVTIGRDQDPSYLGDQPPNIHVERYIPNSLLLPHCDLAVMHGGYTSVLSALLEGVPLVLVPLFADQPGNARACARMGVGQVIDPEMLNPDAVRSFVREGLNEPAYGIAARRVQEELCKRAPIEHAVHRLEELGGAP